MGGWVWLMSGDVIVEDSLYPELSSVKAKAIER